MESHVHVPKAITHCTDESDCTHTIHQGACYLQSYIQQNASFELQKASAIAIMSTAMTAWGLNISEAAS